MSPTWVGEGGEGKKGRREKEGKGEGRGEQMGGNRWGEGKGEGREKGSGEGKGEGKECETIIFAYLKKYIPEIDPLEAN